MAEDTQMNNESSASTNGSADAKKAVVSKRKASAAASKKIRLILDEQDVGNLAMTLKELKNRDAKDFDLNQLVTEALNTIDADYWNEKIEELTPLEWRVQKALEDPSMRDRLTDLLGSKASSEEPQNEAPSP